MSSLWCSIIFHKDGALAKTKLTDAVYLCIIK